MIDGKPEWFRFSGIALADVCLMDDTGKLKFINAVCEMYQNAMNPDYKPEPGGGFEGRAIDRQFDSFREGIDSYMKLVNANPTGKPKGTQRLPNGYPNRTERRTEKIVEEIEEQTRQELLRSGYTEDEINLAVRSVKSWEGIENKTGYIIKIIKSQRSKNRNTVNAQQYTQRDYSGEQEEAFQNMLKMGKEDGLL